MAADAHADTEVRETDPSMLFSCCIALLRSETADWFGSRGTAKLKAASVVLFLRHFAQTFSADKATRCPMTQSLQSLFETACGSKPSVVYDFRPVKTSRHKRSAPSTCFKKLAKDKVADKEGKKSLRALLMSTTEQGNISWAGASATQKSPGTSDAAQLPGHGQQKMPGHCGNRRNIRFYFV